ncbi:MAG: hypothetical protein AB7U35_07760 [Sphingobium sp.]
MLERGRYLAASIGMTGLDLSRRKESIQRIQTGVAGLTGIVLLIGLANIVVDSVKRGEPAQEASVDPSANAAMPLPVDEKPKEPLAELGVAPSPDSAPQTPVVADLQPDPNLKEPMDRPSPDTGSAPAQRPSQ